MTLLAALIFAATPFLLFSAPTTGMDPNASCSPNALITPPLQVPVKIAPAYLNTPSMPYRRDDHGGPDNFGYRWRDNEDGAQYNWLDNLYSAAECQRLDA